jgi:hypothetical protein
MLNITYLIMDRSITIANSLYTVSVTFDLSQAGIKHIDNFMADTEPLNGSIDKEISIDDLDKVFASGDSSFDEYKNHIVNLFL